MFTLHMQENMRNKSCLHHIYRKHEDKSCLHHIHRRAMRNTPHLYHPRLYHIYIEKHDEQITFIQHI